MRKKLCCLLLLFAAWVPSSVLPQGLLQTGDIPRVIDRLLFLHIENKELKPSLIRRSLKIYIENFDGDKSYLLESEVSPYLNLSDQKAEEILSRVQRRDYSDFMELNGMLERAIIRARNLRELIAGRVIAEIREETGSSPRVFARYPQSEYEIVERQRARLARFYQFHQERSRLDTSERKKGVCELFERKTRRFEETYFFNPYDSSAERQEHLFSLRVIKSFAKSLDTHTAFFSPEEAYEMRLSLEKRFDGVGVVLSEGIDGVMIAELIEGGPAYRSGQIKVNDLLVEVDGRPLGSSSFEEVLDLLKQRDRAEIVLGFKRLDPMFKKETFFRVALKKQPIVMKEDRIQSSYEKVEGGVIGKISLHSFYESGDGTNSEKEMKEAIRRFRAVGELKGLVLDLRENSGGFLGQAVRVASLFVSNGVIVMSKYGKGEMHYLRNLSGKSYFSGPLVVLTSKMSASASEIVAQALQDYGVALVVGDERTFGKGSIQYQTITDKNADLFFKVTVGRYYTVSGKSTQIEGVVADIVVPTQYAPYNIGERYLEYPLTPDRVEPAYNDSLSDLDARSRPAFEKRYMPSLQHRESQWKEMLPILKQNSAARIAKNPSYQVFLKKMESIRLRQNSSMVNSIDAPFDPGVSDLQMEEAINILKDMARLRAESEERQGLRLLETGS